jgi:hypothetical protein
MKVSWDDEIPINSQYMEKKESVPNHQPAWVIAYDCPTGNEDPLKNTQSKFPACCENQRCAAPLDLRRLSQVATFQALSKGFDLLGFPAEKFGTSETIWGVPPGSSFVFTRVINKLWVN